MTLYEELKKQSAWENKRIDLFYDTILDLKSYNIRPPQIARMLGISVTRLNDMLKQRVKHSTAEKYLKKIGI